VRAVGIWAAMWLLLAAARLSPATGNVVGRFGLGPCTFGAGCAFKAAGPLGSNAFWVGAMAAGLASSALLAWRLPWRRLKDGPLGAYALGFGLAFLLSLLGRDYYDRYYLVLFPPAIALAGRGLAVPWKAAGGLALLGLWSLLGTWDYLNWNQAKWKAGERLHGMGIPYEAISNGMEWDARFGFEAGLQALLQSGREPKGIGALEWWDPSRYRAFTSFAPRSLDPNLERVGEEAYGCPLNLRTEKIFLWVLRPGAGQGSGVLPGRPGRP